MGIVRFEGAYKISKIEGKSKSPTIIPKIMMVKLYCPISFEMGKIVLIICSTKCFNKKITKTLQY